MPLFCISCWTKMILMGGEDRCSCAPTRRMVGQQACPVCKMAKLAGDENRAVEGVRLLQPIPPAVLGRLRSHNYKYTCVVEHPAVWEPLGANIRAIPVKGFSHEAIQAICRYLNFPIWSIWCPVPNGDLVLCSWMMFFFRFHGVRFGCIPTVISQRISARWHAQRLDVSCFLSNRTIYIHLSCFGFGKINWTHYALRFANPNAALAILLSACLHLEGRHLVHAKLLPSGFPILIFLLLQIECISFAYHSPNNPKRSSSLNLSGRRLWTLLPLV